MVSKVKILPFETMVKKVEELKKVGKSVVQSHGVFDLIHPGIIAHLKAAKGQGDILVVTVINDKDVRKGPGRPIFPGKFRAENVATLELVDYVCLVNDGVPFECVRGIKPDVFAKGQAYTERDSKIHGKIFKEERELYFGKSRIYETPGFSFSSTSIINNFLDIYPDEIKAFLKHFSRKYTFDAILEQLNRLKKMRVLLIGDGIIDEYHYCETMGKSPKSQIIVNRYLDHEVFAGGAFAIANHVAGICDNVQLVTLLGRENSKEDFIHNSLKPNIKTRFFYREDGPTIVKRRYINHYQKQKQFEINYLNDNFINPGNESEIIDYLRTEIPKFDLVLVSDFGHGLITNNIIRIIEDLSKRVAVNAQTNGANAGYNLITKYRKSFFICMDVPEARLATQEKNAEIGEVGRLILKTTDTDVLMITLGSTGSLCLTKQGEVNLTPAISTKVLDVIGAGDAVFAYTAPCLAQGTPVDLVSFIGNAVGAIAVQIVGNKKPVEKHELLEFIHTILKH